MRCLGILLGKGLYPSTPSSQSSLYSCRGTGSESGRADTGCQAHLSLWPLLTDEVLQASSSVSAGLNISGHNQFSLWVSLLFCCSVAQPCPTLQPHGLQHARFPCPSFTISWSLLKFTSIESMVPSNHLILCHPLLLLPSVFPSIRVFSKELALRIRWPKYWSFSFSISPSNKYSGLISFRVDWFALLSHYKLSSLNLTLHNNQAGDSIIHHTLPLQ